MNAVSTAGAALARPAAFEKNPRLSQWLHVDREGTISVFTGKVELGQGIVTALAQIAADELDVAVERIRMVPAATAGGPDEGFTAGSLSIQESGAALRWACAEAKALLLGRAAVQLGTSIGELSVDDGEITAAGARSSTSYWQLADDALLQREASMRCPPKSPREYRVVGTSVPRTDMAGKLTGKPSYVQDLRLPGMLYGCVIRPPCAGARLVSLDETKVGPLPSGTFMVRNGSFLGVVAEREETALKAADTLRRACLWDETADLPSDIHAWLKQHAGESTVISRKTDANAKARTVRTIEASYSKPYLCHASIGPSCAVAQVRDGLATVWTHSQGIFALRRDLAKALEMPEPHVTVMHVEGAGCYGHNAADDAALDAALLARAALGRPVRVQWTREDEFLWAPCGPAMALTLRAALDDSGNIVDWQHELWSNGHSQRPGRSENPALLAAWYFDRAFEQPSAVNPPLPAGGAERNAIPLYEFANQLVVNHYVREMPVRTSALRSLGAYGNVFAIESFMDELAASAGTDPVMFRLRHLEDARAHAVVEAAARAAGWHEWKPAEGRGHGIGFARYKNLGAYCAVVAEVEALREVKLTRLVIAVDVGLVVNPDGVINQIEGGAIQSASWTLKERVILNARGIANRTWEDYPIFRFSDVPVVEVEVLARPDEPAVGAGEAAQGPTAAAIANAVYSALGVRARDLPLTPENIAAAAA